LKQKLDLSKFPTYEVSPLEVFVREDRHRKLFNKKKMDELIASIKALGQLQPGICTFNEESRLELVIGERRLRACGALELPFLYLLKEDLDSFTLELVQLEENIKRSDLDWKEECAAKEKVHKLFQARFGESGAGSAGGHSLADTAEYLGESKTVTHEDIELAVWMREIPEVAAAPNKTTAKKIVERLTQTVKRGIALDEAIASASESNAISVDSLIESSTPTSSTLSSGEKCLLEYDRRCLLGKMEDRLADFKDKSFDIVLFDPPWGVDLSKVSKKGGGTQDYDDEAESFDANIGTWLQLIYTKMKPDSHLYMFFAIRYHRQVYDILELTGFETNRMPLIWHKKGAHVTRNPKLWPGRSYEPIAFARKGNKPLALMGQPDVIITPMPTPAIKGIHPSAKHPMVYRELLERSAEPGNAVLDPMAGSGMAGVAADSHLDRFHLDWWLIEQDSDYRNLTLANLIKGYWHLSSGEERKEDAPEATAFGTEDNGNYLGKYEAPELPSSFQELLPGSDEWRRWWKLHPADQEAMLAYKAAKEVV